MAYLILAYPALAEADWVWIQSIRAEHDQRYFRVVDPHFTLVFPVADLAVEHLLDHVQRQIETQPPIHFVLRCAIVVKDVLSEDAHVFLVPDEGFSQIVRLHDRLYTGLLQPELHLDIPFIPHIGVATKRDLAVCKSLADQLNAPAFTVRGSIDRLDLVRYASGVITPLTGLALTPEAG